MIDHTVMSQLHVPALHRELFGDVNTGINFDRYEDIPVEATGEGCPKNITNFEECDFEKIVQDNIKVTKERSYK